MRRPGTVSQQQIQKERRYDQQKWKWRRHEVAELVVNWANLWARLEKWQHPHHCAQCRGVHNRTDSCREAQPSRAGEDGQNNRISGANNFVKPSRVLSIWVVGDQSNI